jgi:hypothetical protein
MGVDYGVRVIYGYQLNQEIFRKIIKEKEAEDKDFYVYDWLEEIAEMSNCELAYENHYIEVDDLRNTVYFGFPIYNKITAELLTELERDRLEELQDELIRFFNSYVIVDNENGFVPEVHAFVVCD